MRTLERTASPITADADGIAESQTPVGAGVLTLDGTSVSGGIATLDPARRVQINSVGDDSGRTFTIIGTDRWGNAISEAVTGANADAAVSNKVFKTITSISVDDATADAVTVGWTTESITSWIHVGNMRGNFSWRLRAFFAAGGTCNYDIEGTSDNMMKPAGAGEHPDDLQSLAANQTGNYTSENDTPISAVRLKVNSSDVDVVMRVLPSRTA